MHNPQIGPITDDKMIQNEGSIQMPMGILGGMTRSSNQVFQKNNDDSLEGVRYIISTQPSRLRPIRSWTILIEHWVCKAADDIVVHDVLRLCIENMESNKTFNYGEIISDIVIDGSKIAIDSNMAFNAAMAAGVLMNKIDAGRVPDIEKILRIYNVQQ